MTDSGNTHRLASCCELIGDAIGAYSQGPESLEPATEFVAGTGLPFKDAESVFDSVHEGPV